MLDGGYGITLADPRPGAPCRWELLVRLADGDSLNVWRGYKETGLTPAGVYTRFTDGTGGCDTTATVAVEVCP
jgi:hypothetical protein